MKASSALPLPAENQMGLSRPGGAASRTRQTTNSCCLPSSSSVMGGAREGKGMPAMPAREESFCAGSTSLGLQTGTFLKVGAMGFCRPTLPLPHSGHHCILQSALLSSGFTHVNFLLPPIKLFFLFPSFFLGCVSICGVLGYYVCMCAGV